MDLQLIFIGNKFIHNKPLQEYIIRNIEKNVHYIRSISYFKENDNSTFLYLEEEINKDNNIILITTKQSFSTVGKLLCTVTSDNQVLHDNMLIPQKCINFTQNSYLLEHNNSLVNVIKIDEMQKMPQILIDTDKSIDSIHAFEEDEESLKALLSSIAQMYDVNLDIVQVINEWFQINISSKKYGDISKFKTAAKQLLSNKLITNSDIITHIIERLSQNNKKLTFAESCTGGLLSYYFTSHNGASQILDGSLVTYSNDLKENWLGIDSHIIEKNGAVSFDVVKEMSDGALNVSHADYALSISGIAGDTGGTPQKPVGTVFIGIRTKTEHKEIQLLLKGDRNYIQHQTALEAIKGLLLVDKKMFF